MRTSAAEIKLVLSTSLTSDQISAFAADANLWVTEELATSGLSEDRLSLIERYLACALIRLRDLGLKSADFDGVREQYQVDADVTDYLHRAAAFDSTGTVRRAFLAPATTRVPNYRVGTSFTEDTRTTSSEE